MLFRSDTAVDGARAEAAKIGWPLEQFLIEWCTRGSQGLKAKWIEGDARTQNGGTVNKQLALEQRNRAAAEEWLAQQRGEIYEAK